MKALKPISLLTVYYVLIIGFGLMIAAQFPHLVPTGGTVGLSSGFDEFVAGQATLVNSATPIDSIAFALSLFGIVFLMLPVAWIYQGARRRKGREQSFIMAIVLLPVVVAGIVLIVQNSLALAFSLAGIVAGVRFRLTLNDSLDAIYVFIAIGAGLAAGILALEIALLVTLFFNYAILIFWQMDYGSEVSVNRWFSKTWMKTGDEVKDEAIEEAPKA